MKQPPREFRLLSAHDDEPVHGLGVLIPRPGVSRRTAATSSHPAPSAKGTLMIPPVHALLVPIAILAFVAVASFAVVSSNVDGQVAQPVVTIISPISNTEAALAYGSNKTLTDENFYLETRDAFVDEAITFIEADLTAMELRYFKNGVLFEQVPILSKGREGSWWETPAGLYQIELKNENHFSSFGHVYQPWSMVFQGNFFIHGWPEYPDGTPVSSEFSGGCIRLDTKDAEKIYRLVAVGTPVLVHEAALGPDTFVYEPKVPELETPHYLIADIHSNTILASKDFETAVPIASITKLMTALIAAEYINLDQSVSTYAPTFVNSLIPRLDERTKVSMYSLLQLLLVESSNEAAEVIAAQIGRERFIEAMNRKAGALGMTSATFVDPSGLGSGNVASPRDLLRLVQYIYTNRSFVLELTANANLPTLYVSGEFGQLINFNTVKDVDSFIGGKVGETLAAGQTSATLHRIVVKGQERVLLVVLLGSDARDDDVLTLLRYATDRYGG